jgi:hypothetical protein
VAGVRFRRGRTDPSRAAGPDAPTEIEFVAYAGDCVVAGRVDLPADQRLTDLLNASDEIAVRKAALVSHEDGRLVEAPELVLARSEIMAVESRGTRGAANRRISTRTGRIELDVGPYLIRGTVHVRPGTDPLQAFQHPRSMVPITDATIAYESGGVVRTHAVEALIVNRDLISRVAVARDQPNFTDMPQLTNAADPWARDMSDDQVPGRARYDPDDE